MPDGVILEHELARERRVIAERHRGRAIEVFVPECPNGRCRSRAVETEQIQRCRLRDGVVLHGVPCVHLVDSAPGHARHRLSCGDRLRDLNLQRVHAGDVVHDDADLASVPGHACLPLGIGEATGKRCERGGALLKAFGEGVGSITHVLTPVHVWRRIRRVDYWLFCAKVARGASPSVSAPEWAKTMDFTTAPSLTSRLCRATRDARSSA